MSKGATIIEKIIAKAASRKSVEPNELVWLEVDLAMLTDTSPRRFIQKFKKHDLKVFAPDKVAIILDHFNPPSNQKHAEIIKIARDWARAENIKNLFDLKGVCHQILYENALVLPGTVVVGADSHTCTGGAMGAMAIGVGTTDLLGVLITGKTWVRVPETIKVEVSGELNFPIMAKDLILQVIKDLGSDGALYKVLEFQGSAIEKMNLDERRVLCNMSVEAGAKTGIIEADKKVTDHISRITKDAKYNIYKSDPDANYCRTLTYKAEALSSMVAFPHAVDSSQPTSNLKKIKINQVYIGSCTGAKYTDLVVAAKILKDNKISSEVRLLVAPASKKVLERSIKDGILSILLKSGASILPTSCGACAGIQNGLMAAGERCISTTNRNFQGRMGSPDSELYLASPATAAASAITGYITDPRAFLKGGRS